MNESYYTSLLLTFRLIKKIKPVDYYTKTIKLFFYSKYVVNRWMKWLWLLSSILSHNGYQINLYQVPGSTINTVIYIIFSIEINLNDFSYSIHLIRTRTSVVYEHCYVICPVRVFVWNSLIFMLQLSLLVSTAYYYPYFGRLFSFKLGTNNSIKVP